MVVRAGRRQEPGLHAELAQLRARYAEPRANADTELPGGMALRRPRRRPPAIRKWPAITDAGGPCTFSGYIV
jgi:hypothetical protein